MEVRKLILTIGETQKVIKAETKGSFKRKATLFINANKKMIEKNGINIKAVYKEKGDDGSVMVNEGFYVLTNLAILALIGFLYV